MCREHTTEKLTSRGKVLTYTDVEKIFRRLRAGCEWEVLQYGYKAQVVR